MYQNEENNSATNTKNRERGNIDAPKQRTQNKPVLEIVQRASRGSLCASEAGTVRLFPTLFSFALVQDPSWLLRENWRRRLLSTLPNSFTGTGGPRSGQKVSTSLAKSLCVNFQLTARTDFARAQRRGGQQGIWTVPDPAVRGDSRAKERGKKREKERRESRKKQGRSS